MAYETRTAGEFHDDPYQPYQQAFQDYKAGTTDRESEQALNAFQGDTAGLAATFDSINEDDFAAITNAIQSLEFLNPQSAQSPEFVGDVEQRLGQGHPLYGNQEALGAIVGGITGEDYGRQDTTTETDNAGSPDVPPPPNWDSILAAGPPPDSNGPDSDWYPLDGAGDQIPVSITGSDQQMVDNDGDETTTIAPATAQPTPIDQDDFTPSDAIQLAQLTDSHQADDFAALGGQTTPPVVPPSVESQSETAPPPVTPTPVDEDDFTISDATQLAQLTDSHQQDDFAQVGTQLSTAIRGAMTSISFTGNVPTTAAASAMVAGNLGLTDLAGQQQLQQSAGQFVVQAAQAGLGGHEAQQVLVQVAQTGQLSPQMQQAVAHSFQQAHPEANTADSQQAASALERAALALSQSANNMQQAGAGQAAESNTVAPPPVQSGGAGTSNAPVASPRSPTASGGGSSVPFDFSSQGGDS